MNSIARVYSVVLGAVLLLIGLLGWLPALTPDGKLFGIFAINALHNMAHMLTGLIGVGAGLALSDRSVRAYTMTMSAIYGVLLLVGVAQVSLFVQALSINLADNILHAGIFIFSLFVCIVSFTEFNSLQRLQRLTSLRAQPHALAQSSAQRFPADPYAEFVSQRRWANSPDQPLASALSTADRRFAAPAPSALSAADDSPESMQERLMWLEHEVRAMRSALDRQDALEQQQQQLRRELELLRAQVAAAQNIRPTGSPASSQGQTPGQFSPTPGYPTSTPSAPYAGYGRAPVLSGPAGSPRSQASLYPQYPSLDSDGGATPLPRYGPGSAEAPAPNMPQQGVNEWSSAQEHPDQSEPGADGAPSPWRTQPW